MALAAHSGGAGTASSVPLVGGGVPGPHTAGAYGLFLECGGLRGWAWISQETSVCNSNFADGQRQDFTTEPIIFLICSLELGLFCCKESSLRKFFHLLSIWNSDTQPLSECAVFLLDALKL